MMNRDEDGKLVSITIPVPLLAPLGIELDNVSAVNEVWDAIVRPQQEAREPQSTEDRMLMSFLRALHRGMSEEKKKEE